MTHSKPNNGSPPFAGKSGITIICTTVKTARKYPTRNMIACFVNSSNSKASYPDLITTDSPTQRVGAPPIDELAKVPHEKPMLSLDSITDRQDVQAFDTRMKTGA